MAELRNGVGDGGRGTTIRAKSNHCKRGPLARDLNGRCVPSSHHIPLLPGDSDMKQTLLIVALAVRGGTAARGRHPDFSGHWVFNKGQSDNPRDMMRDSGGGGGRMPGGRGGFGGRGAGGRMGGGGRGGFGGGEGRGGGGVGDEQRARPAPTMGLVLTAP